MSLTKVTRSVSTITPVGTSDISDSAVTAAKLASNAVTTDKVADGAITSAKLAPGTTLSVSVTDGAITTAKLADANVTGAKLENVAGLTAGTYGTSSTVPAITVDAKGRVTAVATNPVTLSAPRVKAVKFPEVVGGNNGAFTSTKTMFLDSLGFLRVAGIANRGSTGLGADLYNSNGPGFLTTQVPVSTGETISKIYYNLGATLILSSAGNVYSTGANSSYGGLGLGDLVDRSVFTKITALSNVVDLSVAVTGNDPDTWHALAVTSSGALYAWGYNGLGQLGTGDFTLRSTPTLISGGDIAGKTITKCYAFGQHGYSFVIDSNNDFYSTGYNGQGQLGLGDTTSRFLFTKITTLKASSIYSSGGVNGTYATASTWIIYNGSIWATGSNVAGELGIGSTVDKNAFTAISGITTAVSLATSCNYANAGASVAALLSDGTVRVWGGNTSGTLGINSTTNQLTPTTLNTYGSTTFSKLQFLGNSNNGRNFFALSTSGQMYVCGYRGRAFGNGGAIGVDQLVLVPVRQTNGLTFTDFRVFGTTPDPTILAIDSNGELWSWGYNNVFQTGTSGNTYLSLPQRMPL